MDLSCAMFPSFSSKLLKIFQYLARQTRHIYRKHKPCVIPNTREWWNHNDNNNKRNKEEDNKEDDDEEEDDEEEGEAVVEPIYERAKIQVEILKVPD